MSDHLLESGMIDQEIEERWTFVDPIAFSRDNLLEDDLKPTKKTYRFSSHAPTLPCPGGLCVLRLGSRKLCILFVAIGVV